MLVREKLVINTAELGNKLPKLIAQFRYPNPAFYQKQMMKITTAGIEPTLYHYALEDGPGGKLLVLPRGGLEKVRAFYIENNLPLRILDQRVTNPISIDWKMRSHSVKTGEPLVLGQHQHDIINALLEHEGGLIQAKPGCISGDTIIRFHRTGRGFKSSIEKAYTRFHRRDKNKRYNWDKQFPTYVRSYNNNTIQLHEIEDIVYSGVQLVYELLLDNGYKIKTTAKHLIMTKEGWKETAKLSNLDEVMCDTPYAKKNPNRKKKRPDREISGLRYHPFARVRKYKSATKKDTKRMEYHRAVYEAHINNLSIDEYINIIRTDEVRSKQLQFVNQKIYDIHHIDFNHFNNDPLNLETLTKREHLEKHRELQNANFSQGIPEYSKVVSVAQKGEENTYDIICKDPYRNFSANDIIIHNSGKSIAMFGLIAEVKQPTLIIMHEHRLRSQWEAEIKDKVQGNFTLGRLDGDKKEEGDVVLGLFQTATKIMETYPSWFNQFGMVIVDEVHHASAETFNKLITNTAARYRVGVTGTVKRSDGLELLVFDMFGKILIDIEEHQVKERIVGFEPLMFYTGIDFNLPIRYTYQNGKKDVAYDHTKALNMLTENEERNALIIKNVIQDINEGHFPLVLSDRVEHCEKLAETLEDIGYKTTLLISKTRKKIKWEVVKEDMSLQCIVAIGKIASEGLDLPRLSSIHLTCPTTNESQIRQKIARVRRFMEGKPVPRVWDYVDNAAFYWRRDQTGEKVKNFTLKRKGDARRLFYKRILAEYAEA